MNIADMLAGLMPSDMLQKNHVEPDGNIHLADRMRSLFVGQPERVSIDRLANCREMAFEEIKKSEIKGRKLTDAEYAALPETNKSLSKKLINSKCLIPTLILVVAAFFTFRCR